MLQMRIPAWFVIPIPTLHDVDEAGPVIAQFENFCTERALDALTAVCPERVPHVERESAIDREV
jgi:hypothetical protein